MKRNKHKYLSKEEALSKLQRYCAYQERCHQEVRTKLLDLGIYGDILEEIITELIIDNFLNEERFAKSYARGKFVFKKWGRIKIKQELKLRKLSAYCIKKGMQEIEDDDYQKTIEELLKKKDKYERETDPYKRRNKLARYLIQKGYESALIWKTIKQLEL